ncbi:unnamed protein product, partial [marine sediment metagenome]
MAKLKNSILGLNVSGTISGAITFLRRMRHQIAEKKPELIDAKTGAQLSWRHMFLKVVALWHDLSAAEKLEWESAARPKHMTGYAWFVSQALRPNPGIYLPLQGGTMQGNIDMAKHRLLKLPLPTDAQEAASKAYADALILPATQVEPSHIDPATFDDLQDLINNTMSSGRTSGGLIEASGALGDIKVNL